MIMPRHIYSQEGFFGEINHYDENGYIGHSEPGLIDGYNHYDADGNLIGYSQEGFFGEMNHYGINGYEGTSVPGVLGGEIHRVGNKTGFSSPNIIDGFDTWIDDPDADADDMSFDP